MCVWGVHAPGCQPQRACGAQCRAGGRHGQWQLGGRSRGSPSTDTARLRSRRQAGRGWGRRRWARKWQVRHGHDREFAVVPASLEKESSKKSSYSASQHTRGVKLTASVTCWLASRKPSPAEPNRLGRPRYADTPFSSSAKRGCQTAVFNNKVVQSHKNRHWKPPCIAAQLPSSTKRIYQTAAFSSTVSQHAQGSQNQKRVATCRFRIPRL